MVRRVLEGVAALIGSVLLLAIVLLPFVVMLFLRQSGVDVVLSITLILITGPCSALAGYMFLLMTAMSPKPKVTAETDEAELEEKAVEQSS